MKRRNSSRTSSAATRKRARSARSRNPESHVVEPRYTEALAVLHTDDLDVPLALSKHSERVANASWAIVEEVLQRAANRFDLDAAVDDDADQTKPAPASGLDSTLSSEDFLTVYTQVSTIYELETERGEPVKRAFYALVHQFVRNYVDNQLAHLQRLSGQKLLQQYCRRWHISNKFIAYLYRNLRHMHKYWIPNTNMPQVIMSVTRLRLVFWKELMRTHVPNLTDQIIALIDDDRRTKSPIGHADATLAIRETLATFKKIGDLDVAPDQETSIPGHGLDALKFYETAFEKAFLRATTSFYSNVAGNYRQNIQDPAQLVSYISQMFEDEDSRLIRLVEERTLVPTRRALEAKLIADHVDMYHAYAHKLVSSPQPLDKANKQSLRTVVRLLSRVSGGLDPVRDVFRKCVVQEGCGILQMHLPSGETDNIANFSKYLPLVSHMLQLHNRRLRMVHESFEKRNEFSMALDAGFRDVLNAHASATPVSMAVILAHYAHHVLSGEILDDVPLIPKVRGDNEDRIRIETVISSGTVPSKRARPRMTAPPVLTSRTYSQRVLIDNANRDPRVRGLRRSARLRKKSSSDAVDKETVNDDDANASSNVVMDADISTLPLALRDCPMPMRRRDEVLDTHMDRVARLFVFVEDKEGFFETARQLMARRLLGRYAERLESKFILRLQEYTGPQFTSKLDGMLADMKKSRETRSLFAVAVAKGDCISTIPMRYLAPLRESRVHALNSLYWPKFKQYEWRIPRPLRVIEDAFENYYCARGTERSATWIRSLGSVTIGAKVGGHSFTVEASVLQACVLMQLNSGRQITVKQAAEHANAELDDIRLHLAPLCTSGLLRITEEENVEVNDDYNAPRGNITTRGNSGLLSQTQRTPPRRTQFVKRSEQIDAAIVRTLKKNKRMTAFKLAQEITQFNTKLLPDVTEEEIVKRTDRLVEQEFLGRDDDIVTYRV